MLISKLKELKPGHPLYISSSGEKVKFLEVIDNTPYAKVVDKNGEEKEVIITNLTWFQQ